MMDEGARWCATFGVYRQMSIVRVRVQVDARFGKSAQVRLSVEPSRPTTRCTGLAKVGAGLRLLLR
jgi:hypothetical protein